MLPPCQGPSDRCQPFCEPHPPWRRLVRTPHQYHINSEAETETEINTGDYNRNNH